MEAPPPSIPVAAPVTLACAGCHTELTLAGSQPLRDGSGAETLGALAPLFRICERLDIYACPRCGRIEFFVEGLSRQLQNDSPTPAAEGAPSAAPTSGPRTAVSTLFQEAWRLDQQEQWEGAVARYELVMERFPGTTFARDAEQRICKIRLKLGI